MLSVLADWFPFDGAFLKSVSSRIVNEVEGVCRVVYDSEYPFLLLGYMELATDSRKSPASLPAPLRWSDSGWELGIGIGTPNAKKGQKSIAME